jgi:hypothetical protein
VHVDDPALMQRELRAALETLERGIDAGAPARAATAPRFKVIEGGRSAASSR